MIKKINIIDINIELVIKIENFFIMPQYNLSYYFELKNNKYKIAYNLISTLD